MDRILQPSYEVVPNQNLRSIINNISPELKEKLEDILIKSTLDDIDRWTIILTNSNNDKQ